MANVPRFVSIGVLQHAISWGGKCNVGGSMGVQLENRFCCIGPIGLDADGVTWGFGNDYELGWGRYVWVRLPAEVSDG